MDAHWLGSLVQDPDPHLLRLNIETNADSQHCIELGKLLGVLFVRCS
jgi:hypothetical protein